MVWLWLGFLALVFILLALDLGVFHRHAHVIGVREALGWSGFWISLGVLFSLVIYLLYQYRPWGIELGDDPLLPGAQRLTGATAAVQYLTGYVLEKSLSMDNIFVIALIFTYFAVPRIYQHRLLFWGILGALVMRGAMILGGIALVQRFEWILYVFGAFLIYSAVKMLVADADPDPKTNLFVRLARRLMPITDEYHGQHFVVRVEGRRMFTPIALALITVESADVIFAVDSIPAIFAITKVPFIVFTSNVFAILGLRSLFFALAGIMHKFHYLKVSLVLLLMVIGVKMLLRHWFERIPGKEYLTLGLVVLILAGGVIASVIWTRRHPEAQAQEPPPGGNP